MVTFTFWQIAIFAAVGILFVLLPLWAIKRIASSIPPACSAPGYKSGIGGMLLFVIAVLIVEALAALFMLGRAAGEALRVMTMDSQYVWPAFKTLIPDLTASIFLIAAVVLLTFVRSSSALYGAVVCAWLGGPLVSALRLKNLGVPITVTSEPSAYVLLTAVISLYLLFAVRPALTYGTRSGRELEARWKAEALASTHKR
jgi:hypothetical protein